MRGFAGFLLLVAASAVGTLSIVKLAFGDIPVEAASNPVFYAGLGVGGYWFFDGLVKKLFGKSRPLTGLNVLAGLVPLGTAVALFGIPYFTGPQDPSWAPAFQAAAVISLTFVLNTVDDIVSFFGSLFRKTTRAAN